MLTWALSDTNPRQLTVCRQCYKDLLLANARWDRPLKSEVRISPYIIRKLNPQENILFKPVLLLNSVSSYLYNPGVQLAAHTNRENTLYTRIKWHKIPFILHKIVFLNYSSYVIHHQTHCHLENRKQISIKMWFVQNHLINQQEITGSNILTSWTHIQTMQHFSPLSVTYPIACFKN